MSNPTREQILAAHYATEQLSLLATSITERHDVKDYKEMILKGLPPKPLPTMEDVKWDEDKHFFAEAKHHYYGTAIMLNNLPATRRILALVSELDVFTIEPIPYEDLTPTGKRYTLT